MYGYYERWYSEHWYFDSDPHCVHTLHLHNMMQWVGLLRSSALMVWLIKLLQGCVGISSLSFPLYLSLSLSSYFPLTLCTVLGASALMVWLIKLLQRWLGIWVSIWVSSRLLCRNWTSPNHFILSAGGRDCRCTPFGFNRIPLKLIKAWMTGGA